MGGSLYSTAEEVGLFARMILNRGRHEGRGVLSDSAWSEIARLHYSGKPYGLGWTLRVKDRRTVSMQHFGALQSYRSTEWRAQKKMAKRATEKNGAKSW